MFLLVMVLVGTLSIFGFWRPGLVFNHAYDNPQAKGADFLGDVKRLLKHRAIYPVILINLLWNFMPGAFTPMQFFLTNQLHASDAVYADFSGLYNLFYIPPILLYGFLCTKFPPRKLLVWSVLIGVPQFIPMAFIHSGRQALLMAVLIGLMGGMANAGCIDIAIRACPPGLQGTMMMIIAATFALSSRGGDVVGSWIYALNPKYGFDYCVLAITISYALILPVIPFLPKELTAAADGELGPAGDAFA
jgi:MFS family permease